MLVAEALLSKVSELLYLCSCLIAILAKQRRDIADKLGALNAHSDEFVAHCRSFAILSAHFLNKQDHISQLTKLIAVDELE